MKTQPLTACKRHSPAAGATQGYDRLHANRSPPHPTNSNYRQHIKFAAIL